MSQLWRRLLLVAMDVLATVAAVLLAFVMRFDGSIPPAYLYFYVKLVPVLIPMRIIIYHMFGLYSQVWTHASVPELLRLVWAVTVDSAVAFTVIFLLQNNTGFPRSVILIGWFLNIGALGTIRLLLRLRHEWYSVRQSVSEFRHKTLIFGAGDAGAMLAREFAKHRELGCHVMGFIDDDPLKQGYKVAGKPVLGTRAQIRELVQKHGITYMVIAAPSANSSVIREVVETARTLHLNLKTLPGLYEWVNGKVSISQIRDVQIEDLLGREEVKVDLQAIAAYLADETIMVTGAGGSIGSELCRQVCRFGPKKLILLGHGENSIYDIDAELRVSFPAVDIRPVIADIQDDVRIRRVFETSRPGVVFHAAAHKHVPLMEENPEEAIKNNVLGTINVASCAHTYRAKRFVMISSDKAVNPSSVMGATKRAAELIVNSFARNSDAVFVSVRFGNVLGSRGSVVPLFRRQITMGGPVTVTDPRMVRYFMTIPEAAQLVIQAGSMGNGGETFVLDMGKPIKIVDLARDLIRLSGLEPDVDIPITVTGIRPGEKLYEELLTTEEGMAATTHHRIFVTRAEAIPEEAVYSLVDELRFMSQSGGASPDRIRKVVEETVGTLQYSAVLESGA